MALVSLEAAKQWLSITNSIDDVLLQRLLDAASSAIENYLKRSVLLATYSETFDGQGGRTCVMKQFPVSLVRGVWVDGNQIPQAITFGDSGFRFTEDVVLLTGYSFSRGLQNVSIVYDAGYAVVPDSIQQAVIELVGLRYKERDRIGFVSKSIAGETVTFVQKDLTPAITFYLNAFRRVTL